MCKFSINKKLLIIIAIVHLFISCGKEDVRYEFSPSDLDWIVYNGETLELDKSIKYHLSYLLNREDTIIIDASAGNLFYENCYHVSKPNHYDEIWYIGESELIFGSVFDLIGRVNINSYLSLSVEIGIPGQNDYLTPLQNTDTAFVNGKIYYDVHKYYPLNVESDKIESFYFQKAKGFIKIVKRDGSFVELIDY